MVLWDLRYCGAHSTVALLARAHMYMVLYCKLVPLAACALAGNASAQPVGRSQGWLGVYHTAHGPVSDGNATDAWATGSWGSVAVENAPKDGGWDLR